MPGTGVDIQGFHEIMTQGGVAQRFYYDEIRFNNELAQARTPNGLTQPHMQLRAIGVVGGGYQLPTGPDQVTDYVVVGIKAGVLGAEALKVPRISREYLKKIFYRGNAALTVARLPLAAVFAAMRTHAADLKIAATTIATADLPLADAPVPLWLPGFPPRAMLLQRAPLYFPPVDP